MTVGSGAMTVGMPNVFGSDVDAADVLASGNTTRAFGLTGNEIAIGAPADLVVMDAALDSRVEMATEALAAGEWPGVALVITDGMVRVNGSQCTLRSRRVARTSSHN